MFTSLLREREGAGGGEREGREDEVGEEGKKEDRDLGCVLAQGVTLRLSGGNSVSWDCTFGTLLYSGVLLGK